MDWYTYLCFFYIYTWLFYILILLLVELIPSEGSLEVVELVIGVGFDGLGSLLPVSRAYFSVLIGVLEGLDKSEDLMHASSYGGIVDLHVSDDALLVDDEKAPKTGTVKLVVLVLYEDAVAPGYLLGDVREEGEVELAHTALVPLGPGPGEVAEGGVNREPDDVSIQGSELLCLLGEGGKLGGADEGEIEGVEEQDEVLSFVVFGIEFDNLVVDYCFSVEVGGRASWEACSLEGDSGQG